MPLSDHGRHVQPRRPALDWRGWLVLAWVVWFGVLYAQMVVARRGGKVRAMLHARPILARPL